MAKAGWLKILFEKMDEPLEFDIKSWGWIQKPQRIKAIVLEDDDVSYFEVPDERVIYAHSNLPAQNRGGFRYYAKKAK